MVIIRNCNTMKLTRTAGTQVRYDWMVGNLLCFILLFPILTSFFGSISNMVLKSTSFSTYVIYAFAFIYIYSTVIFNKEFRPCFGKFTASILLSFLFLLLNYLLFPNTRIYYAPNSVSLLLNIFIYIPIGFLCTRVKNWKLFFDRTRVVAPLTATMAIVGLTVLHFEQSYTYMEISNAILIGFLLGWYDFWKRRNMVSLISSLVIFFIQLFFGSRMSAFSCVAYAAILILIDIFCFKNTKKKMMKYLLISVLLLILGLIWIVYGDLILMRIGIQSRTIERLLNGTFGQSSGRDIIYDSAKDIISTMGFQINGVFGDRLQLSRYLFNNSLTTGYVHNVFYELLISFGWLGGLVAIFTIIAPLVKRFIFTRNNQFREIVSLFFCLIFLRLLVSGSCMIEGYFFVFVFVIYNKNWTIQEHYKKTSQFYGGINGESINSCL